MVDENVIEVHDLKKMFKVYYDKGNQLKEKILFRTRSRYEERWVLKGIDFEIKKGESVGLIGHNGCGKSTTLKLLSRIIYPDSGSVEIKGRVSSLIELGAGFHPDLSGRENIYINAAILGLNRAEINRRVGSIIEFSELEDYINNPVRTYSSGMYMRLAFSVAINVDADILLIDEILAVGDIAFQAKCYDKLREIKAQGTTIVLVSHALGQIEQICDRSIWIDDGLIREDGSPRIVDAHYMEYMGEKNSAVEDKSNVKRTDNQEEGNTEKRFGSGEVVMSRVTLENSGGVDEKSVFSTEPLLIRIEYTSAREIDDAVVGIAVYRDDQTYIYGTNTLIDYVKPFKLRKRGNIELRIDSLPLNAGNYTLDFAIHRPDGFYYDFWREACRITVKNKRGEVGIVSLSHEWEIQ